MSEFFGGDRYVTAVTVSPDQAMLYRVAADALNAVGHDIMLQHVVVDSASLDSELAATDLLVNASRPTSTESTPTDIALRQARMDAIAGGAAQGRNIMGISVPHAELKCPKALFDLVLELELGIAGLENDIPNLDDQPPYLPHALWSN